MPSVARIDDDFEECTFDPWVFASASANTSIIEKTYFVPFTGENQPDLIHLNSDGTLVAFECKVIPNRAIHYSSDFSGDFSRAFYICAVDSESIPDIQHRGFELTDQSAAVLYRSAVDECLRNFGSRENGSASYVSLPHSDGYSSQTASSHRLTRVAYERSDQIPPSTGEAIKEILSEFLNSVGSKNLANLPPLRLKLLDDSSYLLEWTFEDRRLGFSFEEDPTESGWYFVYYNGSSERCESGTMDQLEMKRLIGLMLRP